MLAGLLALFFTTAAWWALALWPAEDAPAWLERTRSVCFGVAESGLPDAGGWIGLVLGPLGMGAILAFGWNEGLRDVLRRARTSAGVGIVLGGVALGLLALVTGAGLRVHRATTSAIVAEAGDSLPPSSYPRLDRPAAPLALVGQHGHRVDLAAFGGRPALVTFAYAHCQTVCPLIVRDVLEARNALEGTPLEPAVLIVTLDPWRDRPSRLPSMAADWKLPARDAWVLSGTVAEVEAVLDGWEVPRSRDPTTGEVTHPSLAYVIDGAGRVAFASTGGAALLVSLLTRL